MPPTHPSQADVAAAYRTLIAHETEPKEQDFYRARLQRLEQATEPECEFDCRSRIAAAGVGVYCPQCSAKCADTDLATQLAKAIRAAWVDRLDWDELAQGALKFLSSTNRLVPAGGMALTAEQVGWVSLIVNDSNPMSLTLDAWERVRALFPATEPAEAKGGTIINGLIDCHVSYTLTAEEFADLHTMIWEGRGDLSSRDRLRERFPENRDCRLPHPHLATLFCTMLKGHEGTHFDSRRDVQWPLAPAEPAEEETKAEVGGDFIEIVFDGPPEAVSGRFVEVENPQGASISVGEWIDRGDGFWALRIPYPSSPVVPAPTETEWQTWQEVPDDVWFTSTSAVGSLPAHRKRGSLVDWQFRDGSVGVYDVSQTWNAKLMARAPFVAAEEG